LPDKKLFVTGCSVLPFCCLFMKTWCRRRRVITVESPVGQKFFSSTTNLCS